MPSETRRKRNIILVMGAATMLMYGIIYAWSIFIPPLEGEFGWSRSETSMVFSVAMIGLSLGMLSVGQIAKRFSLKTSFVFAMVLVPCGLLLCSFINQVWQLYIVYGVLCGVGCGISYTTWTTNVLRWFGDKAGVASGILVMGFGMGALVLGGLASMLIYSPIGWRWAFIIIGLCVLVWSLVAIRFIEEPPQEVYALKSEQNTSGLNLTGSQTVREPSFWLFCMWRSLLMGSVAAIIAETSVMIIGIGGSIALSSAVVGVMGVGNGVGRPIGGIIYDKIGQTRSLKLFPALGVVVSIAMALCYFARSPLLFSVFILAIGLIYGMYSSMNNSYMHSTFGVRHLATNTGISAVILAPFNLVFPLIAALIFEGTGDYGIYFCLIPICTALSLVCGIVCPHSIKKMVDKYQPEHVESTVILETAAEPDISQAAESIDPQEAIG